MTRKLQICKEAYDAKFGENVDFVERTKRVIKEFGKEVATPDATCQGLFNQNHLFFVRFSPKFSQHYPF